MLKIYINNFDLFEKLLFGYLVNKMLDMKNNLFRRLSSIFLLSHIKKKV